MIWLDLASIWLSLIHPGRHPSWAEPVLVEIRWYSGPNLTSLGLTWSGPNWDVTDITRSWPCLLGCECRDENKAIGTSSMLAPGEKDGWRPLCKASESVPCSLTHLQRQKQKTLVTTKCRDRIEEGSIRNIRQIKILHFIHGERKQICTTDCATNR